jgi:hypothetical protein
MQICVIFIIGFASTFVWLNCIAITGFFLHKKNYINNEKD